MTQKELKVFYEEELKKAWSDEKMVKHCIQQTAFVIEHNGALYGIKKPRIETQFCFGFGQNGISNDEEENSADKMAAYAQKSKEYFIDENLKALNRRIKTFKEILEDMGKNWAEGHHPRFMVETGAHYCGQTADCKLRYYSVVDTSNKVQRREICEDTELLEKLIAGYEEVKIEFTKRLNTYLKRYGMSKVKTWSYLVD